MKKSCLKKGGFTLTEMIVAIVIIGIVGVCVINVFIYKDRLDRKTRQTLEISTKLTEIFHKFSADPANFDITYQDFIKDTNQEGETIESVFTIPISSTSAEISKNYYKVIYQKDIRYYILEVELYLNDEHHKINDNESLIRRIYHE